MAQNIFHRNYMINLKIKTLLLVLATCLLPLTYLLAEANLVLNGSGKREATIFKVDVYEAKLYLEAKSNNPSEIINSTQQKKLDLFFYRKVSRDQINDAWKEGFEKNSTITPDLQTKLHNLQQVMQDLDKNDHLTFHWSGEDVHVSLNNKLLITISGPDFQKAMLSIWLGANPPNKGLKQGLLGS